jgi:hypothetical protein
MTTEYTATMPAPVSLTAVPEDATVRTETILTEGVSVQSLKVSNSLNPNSSDSNTGMFNSTK